MPVMAQAMGNVLVSALMLTSRLHVSAAPAILRMAFNPHRARAREGWCV
jgi:hypothetical protein